MDRATSQCPLCALLGLLAFSLFGWYVIYMGAAQPDRIIAHTESFGSKALTAAGFPWAQLQIDGQVGHLSGDAPDPDAKSAAVAAAAAALQPATGIPGVFARLEDKLNVNDTAVTLAATGESDNHIADNSASLGLKAWTEPTPQHFEHEVYYPPASAAKPATNDGAVDAGDGCVTGEAIAELGTRRAGFSTWADRSAQTFEHEVQYPGAGPSKKMAVESCESSIRVLLDKEPIRFATSSADIVTSSDSLLDRIAGMITACRGFSVAG